MEKTVKLQNKYVAELESGELITFNQQKELAEYLGITQPQCVALVKYGTFPARYPKKDQFKTIGKFDVYTEITIDGKPQREFKCIVEKPLKPKSLSEMLERIEQARMEEIKAIAETKPVELPVKPKITAETVKEEHDRLSIKVDQLEAVMVNMKLKQDTMLATMAETVAQRLISLKEMSDAIDNQVEDVYEEIEALCFIEPLLRDKIQKIIEECASEMGDDDVFEDEDD